MPQVIRDSEQMRAFATFLQEQCRRMQERQAVTKNSFSQLSEVWRDTHFGPFEQAFNQCMQDLERFQGNSEMYCNFLRQMAERLDNVYRA